MYSSKRNVNTLTALLVAHGVRHVVVCPGSRDAPLAHDFALCPDLTTYPATDERSAAFLALGLRQHVAGGVAVCVTSGSALLGTLPAAAEATHEERGIIIISADRPAAWIGQLDGQTIAQPNALGRAAALSVSLPEGDDEVSRWHTNRLINEALLKNAAPPYPTVHINVPLTEPLFAFGTPALPAERVVRQGFWHDAAFAASVVDSIAKAERPLIVIGQLPPSADIDRAVRSLSQSVTVLSGPLSCGIGQPAFTDQMLYMLRHGGEKYRPDTVLYIGGNTVSKRLRQFLRTEAASARHIVVADDGQLHDVSQHTELLVHGSAEAVLTALAISLAKLGKASGACGAYRERWQALRKHAAARHAAFRPPFSQMLAVGLFEQTAVHGGDTVYYANSMSVRLAALYARHYIYCNRGINGIEGSLSVAAGAALALAGGPTPLSGEAGGQVYCVVGDLSFFYDANALWQQTLTGKLRILLLNNSGGGIFRNLRGLEASPARDAYVAASHTATAEGLCRSFGVAYRRADDEPSLRDGLHWLATAEAPRPLLLEVTTDAEQDSLIFKSYYHELGNHTDIQGDNA